MLQELNFIYWIKRLEEINALVKQLKNSKKIKDVTKANQSKFKFGVDLFFESHEL